MYFYRDCQNVTLTFVLITLVTLFVHVVSTETNQLVKCIKVASMAQVFVEPGAH